jgi:arylsulfatase A-like enzyme
MMTRLLAFTFSVLVALPALAVDPRNPNIIFIVGDDMGYADVGFHGCQDIPTPHLDALAKSGVRCTNGYVSGPYCSPTRAGLLTGRYQQRFGHEFNPGGGGAGLPVTETTIADRFKKAGYATGLVGKWHLGGAAQFHPQKRGFDEFFGFLSGAHSYFPAKGDGVLRGTQPADEKEYLTDAFGREAVAFIEKHKAKPFFLYLAFNAVHTPMHADDARLAKFESISDRQRRTYAAMMSAMDENIGRVLAKLRAEKLEKDTLICFISDNGGPTMKGTTMNGSVNKPLRGSKRTTLEGGIRVPFIISWKDHLPAERTYDLPVIQLDLLPTALAACSIPVKPEDKLDGVDLLPYLAGGKKTPPHETLYWRFGRQMAIRHGDWKLVKYDTAADGDMPGVTGAKLYNLAEDLGESTDLSAKQPDKLKELEGLWKKWEADLAKPLWGGGRAG